MLGTRTPLIGTSVLVNVWDFRRGKGGARAVVVSHRIFRWKVWNFDNTFEKGDVSFRSFGKFSWRADVFTWTFLRIGKPFLPGDSWGNLSVWFSDYGRGGDRMDGKWQRPPRKFTIISTECTRMRARGEEGGGGSGRGKMRGIEKRFRDAFKLSLPLLATIPLFLSGPKLLFFPATFKLCYLFTEFFPYFLLLLLRPGIESYFQRKRRPIIKTFSPSLLPSVIQLPPDFRLSQFIRS